MWTYVCIQTVTDFVDVNFFKSHTNFLIVCIRALTLIYKALGHPVTLHLQFRIHICPSSQHVTYLYTRTNTRMWFVCMRALTLIYTKHVIYLFTRTNTRIWFVCIRALTLIYKALGHPAILHLEFRVNPCPSSQHVTYLYTHTNTRIWFVCIRVFTNLVYLYMCTIVRIQYSYICNIPCLHVTRIRVSVCVYEQYIFVYLVIVYV